MSAQIDSGNVYEHLDRVTAERDRARDIAVTLEQDCDRAWHLADVIFSIAGQFLPAAERDRLTAALAAQAKVAIKP